MGRKKMAPEFNRTERRQRVTAGLQAGLTFREIAEALDCALGTVHNDCKHVMNEMLKESISDVGQYRALELRRIDMAWNAIWKRVRDGELGAIDRLVTLQNQRAKYWAGLHEPERIETKDTTLSDEERERRILEIVNKARARAERSKAYKSGDSTD